MNIICVAKGNRDIIGKCPQAFTDNICVAMKKTQKIAMRDLNLCIQVFYMAIYRRVVSVHRPSGYEPDALPLRHDDFICTAHRI